MMSNSQSWMSQIEDFYIFKLLIIVSCSKCKEKDNENFV